MRPGLDEIKNYLTDKLIAEARQGKGDNTMMTQAQADSLINSVQGSVDSKSTDSASGSLDSEHKEYELKSKLDRAMNDFLKTPSEINYRHLMNTITDNHVEYQRLWMKDRVRITVRS